MIDDNMASLNIVELEQISNELITENSEFLQGVLHGQWSYLTVAMHASLLCEIMDLLLICW